MQVHEEVVIDSLDSDLLSDAPRRASKRLYYNPERVSRRRDIEISRSSGYHHSYLSELHFSACFASLPTVLDSFEAKIASEFHVECDHLAAWKPL